MIKKNIKVVGDIMLDEWCYVKDIGPSAETNINIFKSYKINKSLGGSGNFCMNLKKLNIHFKLYTEIGTDQIGNQVVELLKKKEINFCSLRKKKITSLKKRFFIKKKQIFRQDTEDTKNTSNIDKSLLKEIKSNDIVIISDYKKGVINKSLHSKIIKKKCLTMVDPKNKPFFYKNAFLVKPNMFKFNEWCGKFTKEKAFNLLKKMEWTWLVITDGKKGVHVFNDNNEYRMFKVKTNQKDTNVIGAGDIFFAGLIYFFQKEYNIFDACLLASHASTNCVKKQGIRYVEKKDFVLNTIFTNGVFDILHSGHLKLLKFSKKLGKKLIVGLNSDKSTKILKGADRPFNSVKKRIKNLKKTKLINKIFVFKETTPLKLIKRIQPDIIVKGSDYSYEDVVGSKIANIILFKKKDNLSTTKILKKIRKF
jgi:D-beta-D-heptose 7-phosphate kinase / D-beta-D-heptose 1-phosphate adenosyltransferase